MSSGEHGANPLREMACPSLKPQHVGSSARDEQPSDILVATSADTKQRRLPTGNVLPGNETNRRCKIATAPVLLAVSLEMRTQINAIILALIGHNAGTREPTETYPGMMWGDTTSNMLKRRTNANDGWITIGSIGDFPGDVKAQVSAANDLANTKVSKAGDTMTGALTMANNIEIKLGAVGGAVSRIRGESQMANGYGANQSGWRRSTMRATHGRSVSDRR